MNIHLTRGQEMFHLMFTFFDMQIFLFPQRHENKNTIYLINYLNCARLKFNPPCDSFLSWIKIFWILLNLNQFYF